jgi:hypothetical protein
MRAHVAGEEPRAEFTRGNGGHEKAGRVGPTGL